MYQYPRVERLSSSTRSGTSGITEGECISPREEIVSSSARKSSSGITEGECIIVLGRKVFLKCQEE
jgi:hypothetical protein